MLESTRTVKELAAAALRIDRELLANSIGGLLCRSIAARGGLPAANRPARLRDLVGTALADPALDADVASAIGAALRHALRIVASDALIDKLRLPNGLTRAVQQPGEREAAQREAVQLLRTRTLAEACEPTSLLDAQLIDLRPGELARGEGLAPRIDSGTHVHEGRPLGYTVASWRIPSHRYTLREWELAVTTADGQRLLAAEGIAFHAGRRPTMPLPLMAGPLPRHLRSRLAQPLWTEALRSHLINIGEIATLPWILVTDWQARRPIQANDAESSTFASALHPLCPGIAPGITVSFLDDARMLVRPGRPVGFDAEALQQYERMHAERAREVGRIAHALNERWQAATIDLVGLRFAAA
jgi:hypothetical protein